MFQAISRGPLALFANHWTLLVVCWTVLVSVPSLALTTIQSAEVRNVARQVAELLSEGQFAEAEERIKELTLGAEFSQDGMRPAESLYSSVLDIHDLKSSLNTWVAEDPSTSNGHLLRALYTIDEAWNLRGLGLAHTVSEERQHGFQGLLESARSDLLAAWQLDSSNAHTAATMVRVTRGLGLERKEMETWFDRAVAVDEGAYTAYAEKLTYLLPKWHGSFDEAAAFVRQTLEKKPAGRIPSIEMVLIWELGQASSSARDYFRSPEAQRALDRGFSSWKTKFPDAIWARTFHAQFLRKSGHYQRARVLLEEVMAIDPENAEAELELGWVQYELEDYKSATEEFLKVTELAPRFSRGWYGLGFVTFWVDREYEAAEGYFDRALELRPNWATAWEFKGRSLYERELFETAVPALQTAVEFDSNREKAWYYLGRSLDRLKKYQASIGAYSRAAELDPESDHVWFQSGKARLRTDDNLGAVRDFSRSVELTSSCYDCFYMRGRGWARLDQHEDAVIDYSKALELKESYSVARRYRAESLHVLGRFQEAVEDLTIAIGGKPDSARLYYLRGKSRWAAGDINSARSDFQHSIAIDDKYVDEIEEITGAS